MLGQVFTSPGYLTPLASSAWVHPTLHSLGIGVQISFRCDLATGLLKLDVPLHSIKYHWSAGFGHH